MVVSAAPDGRCLVSVGLEWRGRSIRRTSYGVETLQGRLRAAAQASLAAALEVSDGRADLSLLGVKAVRAFDGWVAIVRVNGTAADRAHRLLGAAACEEEDDLPRAAAVAVLNATNRVLEQLVESPATSFERTSATLRTPREGQATGLPPRGSSAD